MMVFIYSVDNEVREKEFAAPISLTVNARKLLRRNIWFDVKGRRIIDDLEHVMLVMLQDE